MDSPRFVRPINIGVQYNSYPSENKGLGLPSIVSASNFETTNKQQNTDIHGVKQVLRNQQSGCSPQYYFQHPSMSVQQQFSNKLHASSSNSLLQSVSKPKEISLKRPYSSINSSRLSKQSHSDFSFKNMQSSVEDLVSQQLQRNEMDGINQHHKTTTKNTIDYASLLVMNNSVWNVTDMTWLLYAMYRVLLQSKPDAPNELMIQIPVTCSNLLPSILNIYAPCQLQNGNTVKLIMKQLAMQMQEQNTPIEPSFISNEVILRVQKRRVIKAKTLQCDQGNFIVQFKLKDRLFRRDLIYTLLDELNTKDVRKEFYLKEYLRCLVVNGGNRNDFIQSFTVFFYNHIEECIQYEKNCQIGELSQLIINTRNLQSMESSHHSEDHRVQGLGFAYHHHLEFLLSFCSKFFIRPFPKSLFLAILNFFRTSIILCAFNSISKCIYSIVLTQPELATTAIQFFIRSWPSRDSSREVLYLRQVECILQIVSSEKQQVLFAMLFGTIKKALISDNRFVSLQALQLLMRIIHTNLLLLDMKMITTLSDILSSLENHWCDTIRQCSNSCLKTMLLKAELRSSGDEDVLHHREEAFTEY